jgi:choline kinase
MKALILAAGRGTRIRSVHGEHPKCLISTDGEAIIKHVQARYRDRSHRFSFIRNSKFESTNNMYSVWVARDWLRSESFMCLNADVLCDPDILVPAARTNAPISMIIDPEWRDETMKVIVRKGRVSKMSKKICRSEFSGTYIGITTFSAGVQRDFFRSLNNLVASGRVNEFFNVAVQELADAGVKVGFTSTLGLPWAEIDDPADLAFAREHVFPKLVNAAAA